ncbi:MAG: hypothetical protein HDR88_09535 [Bacteroides sp.]|nr:hypothetical protein [Bacteroides sp.]
MAIRFDKDTRRATNGPMIFFSDPSAEISLGEEIRGAIEAKLSFYTYRRPGDMMISFGSSESVVKGVEVPGFVIAPFLPDLPYLTIPYRPPFGLHKKDELSAIDFHYSFPSYSTTRQQHRKEIEAIRRQLDEIGFGKIVAARAIVENQKIDPAATFAYLCRKYPDAFVFCFSTPLTGCWVGASPELLLEAHVATLKTMALAGTRRAHTPGEWDTKNIEEQQMVTDFIAEAFKKNNLPIVVGSTFTKCAGQIEHICTPISSPIDLSGFSTSQLTNLLNDLSPTPALCGLPREIALRIISENEDFSRGFYGGFCGPYHAPGDFSFYVNLRSANIEQDRVCVFVGGGITRMSDPELEWEETSLKSTTVMSALVLE